LLFSLPHYEVREGKRRVRFILQSGTLVATVIDEDVKKKKSERLKGESKKR